MTNTDTAAARVSQTDNAGDYTITSLQPGNYTVTAVAQGFSTVRQQNLKLEVAQVANLDLTLAVGAASETGNVTTTTSSLDAGETTLGSVIAQQQVEDLPLNGRQFSQLLELSPGVVPIETRRTQAKLPTLEPAQSAQASAARPTEAIPSLSMASSIRTHSLEAFPSALD